MKTLITLKISYTKKVSVELFHDLTERELREFAESKNMSEEDFQDMLLYPADYEIALYNYFAGYRTPDTTDEYDEGDYRNLDYKAMKG